ncbi:MAG: hypothetical protein AB2L14_20225 [Candidatus Xenobiia bacterium LiM19]
MTISNGNNSVRYTHERFHTCFDSGNINGVTLLQEQVQGPAETVSPEEASSITGFYNRALQDTDRLRFPLLPRLIPPESRETLQGEHTPDTTHELNHRQEGVPTGPDTFNVPVSDYEMLAPDLSHEPAHTMEGDTGISGGHDGVSGRNGRNETEQFQECSLARDKTYYHGSPEEKLLLAKLDNARDKKNKAEIGKSRENLKAYWRKIINEEYQSLPRSEFPAEVKKQKKNYKYNPDDSFVQYRLHALANKAKESGYAESLKEIERIRNGAWSGTSPTGTEISNFAVDGAKKSNFDSYDCFHYVANALDNSGIILHGGDAYMAADQLARHPKVREIKGLKSEQLTSLPKGAIVVWDRSSEHVSGHISISQGNGRETSDRVREQITDYGTTFRVFMPLDMIEE